MKKLFIIMLIALLVSCTDSKGTIKFLESQGYTNIKTTGFDFWAHGEDDWTTTGFIAISPTGKLTKGAVSDKGWALLRPRMSLRIRSEK